MRPTVLLALLGALLLGAPAAHAWVNQPQNCSLSVTFVAAVYDSKTQTVSGSISVALPANASRAVPVTWGPVLAVTATQPKGAQPPPPPDGAGYGKLRPFMPFRGPGDGPLPAMTILEYPLPDCLAAPAAPGDAGGAAAAAAVAPGKAVSCAFSAPRAALPGSDPAGLEVSVSFPIDIGGGQSGMCAANATKVTVV
ncbi:hypothetical protein Rsub_11364 [Raphidocelis subcapitata]|uniref:Pherophorin domain-containing protein n=1 Tax=Raphidocelis subcapitata TaxID=307507 RepID=A0A2V0PIC1_9CHLO|nr:hypothetical protein Rsub_11364 [Raphidocelis subcapitata]|eukprot:GBF98782.1 hypothetical protein Rsub_11364 [Raphidocelis subcapitata]